MDPRRAERILAFLTDRRLIRRGGLGRPLPASVEGLLRVHTPEWLAALDDPVAVSAALGTPVNEDERRAAVTLQRLHAGGSVLAARVAWQRGGHVAHLAGGLHHAMAGQGHSFCLFNDIAIAIRHLRHYGCDGPILVVDLDLHDGNGTRAIFAGDPTVHTFSIHNADWEPPGGVGTTSLALGTAVDDATYLDAVRSALPPVVAAHRPVLVFYVAGVDGAEDDRLGDWRITADGMLARDRFVLEAVEGIPLVSLLAGGYGSGAWRYTARFLAWAAKKKRIEPPDDLAESVRRLRASDAAPPTEGPADDNWGITAEDLYALAPRGRSHRVLERFSPLALEVSLERAGLLGALRARGFTHPIVVTDTSSGVGDTIFIYGDEARTELLMELRLARSAAVFPGMEVLVAEWLRLQNPRAAFSHEHPRLPGQEHPGLGLLQDVVAWVVLLCEELDLDALVARPGEEHVAALARRHFREVAGRMVYPVSSRLKALLDERQQDALAEPQREPGNEG